MTKITVTNKQEANIWKKVTIIIALMLISTTVYSAYVDAASPGVQRAREIAKHGVLGDITVKTSQSSPCNTHNDNVVAVFNDNSFMHGAGWISRDSSCAENKFLVHFWWPITGSATHVLRSFPGSITDGMIVQGEVKKDTSSSTCWTAKTRISGVQQFSFQKCANASGTWGVQIGAGRTTDTTSTANVDTQFQSLKFFQYCSDGSSGWLLWSQDPCGNVETPFFKCLSQNGYELNVISDNSFKAGKSPWTNGSDGCSASQDAEYPYDHWGE